jgi:hypothetical protein
MTINSSEWPASDRIAPDLLVSQSLALAADALSANVRRATPASNDQ